MTTAGGEEASAALSVSAILPDSPALLFFLSTAPGTRAACQVAAQGSS